MEIIKALKIDDTLWIQLSIFTVTYFFMYFVLFKPYMKALSKRRDQTQGTHEVAERLVEEAQELETHYESKARSINQKFKTIFDESRTLALREHDEMVSKARQGAKQYIDQARVEISDKMAKAEVDVMKEAPIITTAIASKLLGKDLKA